MENFFAEKVSDTFEESVDVCVDALSKQLTNIKKNCAVNKKIAESF